MNFFDISGTNRSSFSIGLGENKVELFSKNGKLFIRNFDSSIIDISTISELTNNFEIKEWQANTQMNKNNLIIYNNSLFICNTTHLSTTVFNDSFFTHIISYNALAKIPANNNSVFFILKNHGNDFYFYGSNTGIHSIIFPNCLFENIGKHIRIYNFSNCTLNIYLNDQTTYFSSVNLNQTKEYLLISNLTSNGEWKEVDYFQLEEKEINEVKIEETNNFSIGDILSHDGSNWILASIDSNFSPIGIIRDRTNDYFVLVFYGYLNLVNYLGSNPFPFIIGKEYYLSTNGNWTTTFNKLKQPVFTAFSSTEVIVNFKSSEKKFSFNIEILNNQIFSENISFGIYKIYYTNNPEKNCMVYYSNNNVILKNSLPANNIFFNLEGTLNKINIFKNLSNNFCIENKTGNTINLTIIAISGEF